ncbi:MAG: tetratricopeptide repeat protein [Pseudomonadaceae bacterium]|nr:MAG: tetratricopeptide repeat protein [Pseudomonadaceae bacterium]
MLKRAGWMIAAAVLVTGCAGTGGAIPVVDSGRSVSNDDRPGMPPVAPTPSRRDAAVVLVPDGAGGSRPVESWPVEPSSGPTRTEPDRPASSGSGLQADEQLDGPVLALLTSARQQEGQGDLNAASASLERAMRIAPREPQVLHQLAQVRLAQGDAAQAEQLAQRGLSYADGRPTLQASLWQLIAEAREKQGDRSGAEQARERARVVL